MRQAGLYTTFAFTIAVLILFRYPDAIIKVKSNLLTRQYSSYKRLILGINLETLKKDAFIIFPFPLYKRPFQ